MPYQQTQEIQRATGFFICVSFFVVLHFLVNLPDSPGISRRPGAWTVPRSLFKMRTSNKTEIPISRNLPESPGMPSPRYAKNENSEKQENEKIDISMYYLLVRPFHCWGLFQLLVELLVRFFLGGALGPMGRVKIWYI